MSTRNSFSIGYALILAAGITGRSAALASNLDTIGLTLLRAVTTNLNGSGVAVAQPEAGDGTATNWEVSPTFVNLPVSRFTYTSSFGSSSTFPNSVGAESSHADAVGMDFYGIPGGVATNVTHVWNYEANYFISSIVQALAPLNAPIINQSFTFRTNSAADDQLFDNYAAKYNTLFVSGAGLNNEPVYSPATCYNGIGVGVAGTSASPHGPTPDGRSKPDLIAPGVQDLVTSYSTPQVSGAAALLLQGALRGDGGSDTISGSDIRTVKALLLNGAIKPVDWTNGPVTPLDARYGAGVLNVFNSYRQLAGGKQTNFVSTVISHGNPHPPANVTNTIPVLSGWDFETLYASSGVLNGVNHYYFDVTNSQSSGLFTATITLAWNRQLSQSSINNLDLFLYDANSGIMINASTSAVDNVEHIFVPKLPPGRYDVQVLNNGGIATSPSETYALAFEFFSMPLNIALSGSNVAITWPLYPTGFVLESTTNLSLPTSWSTNLPAPTLSNGQNQVVVDASTGTQFFRLRRP